jgi:hypothetical protein
MTHGHYRLGPSATASAPMMPSLCLPSVSCPAEKTVGMQLASRMVIDVNIGAPCDAISGPIGATRQRPFRFEVRSHQRRNGDKLAPRYALCRRRRMRLTRPCPN